MESEVQEIDVRKRGRTVATVGAYSVVEFLEIYLDGTRGVLGYHLLGPGADSDWLHGSVEEAESAAHKLINPHPVPGG
ncbi:MAG: hypothetical protein OMOMHJEC_03301 [Xanthomonadales bacterium]|nr:hypothetical protein [Xanthomonadales bacterium]